MNLLRLPALGPNDSTHVVIESPRGSTVKLKYDPQLEAFTLSRPLAEGLIYPCDWGFVPSTQASDGDPLDAAVIWDRSTFPGVVLECRVLGVLAVEQNSKHDPDQRERNDRLIAVPSESSRQSELTTVDDLTDRQKGEIEAFFLASSTFQNKNLKFVGWFGPQAARRLVQSSLSNSFPSSGGALPLQKPR